ncbi:hypothetical protein ANCCAN_24264 [Ancylostoma caninum]|uniref:Uncharacterized protein n=1 Tax=Ancylostoma caninum TaxID=29170 RepID=A0A368FG55_ANCCA|nr:hypothetical protein ANCCAN_24264 [Ancylostoma caninum]
MYNNHVFKVLNCRFPVKSTSDGSISSVCWGEPCSVISGNYRVSEAKGENHRTIPAPETFPAILSKYRHSTSDFT